LYALLIYTNYYNPFTILVSLPSQDGRFIVFLGLKILRSPHSGTMRNLLRLNE
jgi:hypothetical protein